MATRQALRDSAPTKPKRLLLDAVSKRFGSMVALQTMSLEIQPGELVALLGPSGCGKTTTLRLVAGFSFPDTGTVSIDGQDVSHLPPNKRGLGMVFQNYSLFPHMSVGENIAFGLQMAGVPKAEREASVQRMLDLIRLPDYGPRHISQLSGGQQQRVALARAIVTNPSVLLLDEPLGALDKNLREGMQVEIRRLQQTLGITTMMVTHDQEEAMTMSDRIVVMNEGRILQIGAPREVYERPRTRFVAEFLGTANILPCRVTARTGERIQLSSGVLDIGATVPADRLIGEGQTVDVAIRPEKLVLEAAQPHHVSMRGGILEHIFRGSQHTYLVDVPALAKTLYVCEQVGSGAAAAYAIGQAVTLSFDPQDAVVLEDDTAGAVRAAATAAKAA
jgi:putative spermidine/putrescine transport system ATP-binding protein